MPAGKTYIKIASQTLGSDTATVTFSNLPQNYTDLIIVGTKQANNNGSFTPSPALRFNGDTGSNYSSTLLDGNGSAASSNRYTSGTRLLLGYAIGIGLNSDAIVIWQIQNYSNSTTYKTVLGRLSNPTTGTAPGAGAGVGLWQSTAAITSITLSPGERTWSAGAGFTLYGIECAKSPYAEGGDKVYSTGTHWVHEFYYSGQFVPRQNLTADYLVVAGGGGGGADRGGGGGAGGYRTSIGGTALSLNAFTNYTVTVGAGGTGGTVTSGNKGSNSVFSTITSTGGGFGRQAAGTAGAGGSGGGGWGASDTASNDGGTGNEGSYSPAEGFNGGAGEDGGNRMGGGGGGASEAGNTDGQGYGGDGASSSITGSAVTRAGGGGGGSQAGTGIGGDGGGGNGTNTGNGSNGSTNTGSGGGGGGDTGGKLGGNGGSGIVIVRYSI